MSTVVATPGHTAKVLLEGIVDYAGLFPPASATMAEAVTQHAAERAGADAWMLGRFVLPAVRLAEFAPLRTGLGGLPSTWLLSAIVGTNVDVELKAVARFNQHYGTGMAVVDSLEVKADSVQAIDDLARLLPAGVQTFVELPLSHDPLPLLHRLAQGGLMAKVRTGGVAADAFPAPGVLARHLSALVASGVPFKATAGLHHPVRGVYRLTYAPDAPVGTMYGYLNVLLATAALYSGWTLDRVTAVLDEHDAAAFTFLPDAVRWRDATIGGAAIATTRTRYFRSFGSCSFREPVDEIRPLVFPTT